MTAYDAQPAPISWDGLPTPIRTYLAAHAAGDTSSALASFADDAVVTDEGHDYSGVADIAVWLSGSASTYTYTAEFTGATALDAKTIDVEQHLEGDFPGGIAELHFRFTVGGARITRLVIEP